MKIDRRQARLTGDVLRAESDTARRDEKRVRGASYCTRLLGVKGRAGVHSRPAADGLWNPSELAVFDVGKCRLDQQAIKGIVSGFEGVQARSALLKHGTLQARDSCWRGFRVAKKIDSQWRPARGHSRSKTRAVVP